MGIKSSFTVILVAGVAIFTAAGAVASGMTDCARDAASDDLAAKTVFQRALRDLIIQERPEFKELASLNSDLQIAYGEARFVRIEYLLRYQPARIDAKKGIGKLSNFAWSDKDEKAFLRASVNNNRQRQLDSLKSRNESHPDWPDMRQYFKVELSQSDNFKKVLASFDARRKQIETTLHNCVTS